MRLAEYVEGKGMSSRHGGSVIPLNGQESESKWTFDGMACGGDSSSYFCGAGEFIDEPELLTEYEHTLDIFHDVPNDLDRPLPWKLTLAHRGGNWGDAPVPTRCEVCQINFSSHTLLENHFKSPRHARNSRYAIDTTPASPSQMIISHARSPRAKKNKRSGSLAPRPAKTTPQDEFNSRQSICKPDWENDSTFERHTCISKVEAHVQAPSQMAVPTIQESGSS